jgi:hypothetical protein
MFRPIQFVWWHKTKNPIQPIAAVRMYHDFGQTIPIKHI